MINSHTANTRLRLVECELASVDLSRELRAVRLTRRTRGGGDPALATGQAARRFWSWLAARAQSDPPHFPA